MNTLTRVHRRVLVNSGTDCWIWMGGKNEYGYGRFRVDPRHNVYVHRFMFEQWYGPIPEGLVLDHLCRVHHCVFPDHLESVTQSENAHRNTVDVCRKQSHPRTPENTYTRPDGTGTFCVPCAQEREKKRDRRKKT